MGTEHICRKYNAQSVYVHISGSVQDCGISIMLELEMSSSYAYS